MTSPAQPAEVVAEAGQPVQVDVDAAVLQFRSLADWHANRIQWREEDHEDLVQEGLLELVKTLRGYNSSGREIRDLSALAGACFNAAMQWWYKKNDRNLNFVGFEGLTIPVDNMQMHFSQICVDQYLQELERVHGAIAREIVQHLISPGEQVGEYAISVMEAKRRRKEAGEHVVGYASPGTRIQKQHIREVLKLDTKNWDRMLGEIKKFTREYLCRDDMRGTSHSASRGLPPSSGFPTTASTTLS